MSLKAEDQIIDIANPVLLVITEQNWQKWKAVKYILGLEKY
jgi:hypothetical protein